MCWFAQDEPDAGDAGEEAAGIAEEDAGGRAVPPEETEESACGGEARGWGAVEGGGGECGGGDAGALAVTVVEQIESVGEEQECGRTGESINHGGACQNHEERGQSRRCAQGEELWQRC